MSTPLLPRVHSPVGVVVSQVSGSVAASGDRQLKFVALQATGLTAELWHEVQHLKFYRKPCYGDPWTGEEGCVRTASY